MAAGGLPFYVRYLLYHDAVDAHVYITTGEVEQVHPAEGETHYQEGQELLPPAQIQPGRDQEESALQQTVSSRAATVICGCK